MPAPPCAGTQSAGYGAPTKSAMAFSKAAVREPVVIHPISGLRHGLDVLASIGNGKRKNVLGSRKGLSKVDPSCGGAASIQEQNARGIARRDKPACFACGIVFILRGVNAGAFHLTTWRFGKRRTWRKAVVPSARDGRNAGRVVPWHRHWPLKRRRRSEAVVTMGRGRPSPTVCSALSWGSARSRF
jgi:hypothetical protein